MTNPSLFSRTFIFLTKLAWNSRVTLPLLVTIAFMAMDFRMQVEINVQTERIVHDEPYMVMEVNNESEDDSSWETISETSDDVENENGHDNSPEIIEI